MDKEVKKYLRWLQQNNFDVKRTRSSHWKVYYGGRLVGVLPSTPSDHRSVTNTKKRLEKAMTVDKQS